jgi:hypothetical protein
VLLDVGGRLLVVPLEVAEDDGRHRAEGTTRPQRVIRTEPTPRRFVLDLGYEREPKRCA